MKTIITLVIVAFCAAGTQGQTLYVGCYRSIDNARLQADSIRVLCPQLKIDSIVTGSAFVLPTTTAIVDHASEYQASVPVDLCSSWETFYHSDGSEIHLTIDLVE